MHRVHHTGEFAEVPVVFRKELGGQVSDPSPHNPGDVSFEIDIIVVFEGIDVPLNPDIGPLPGQPLQDVLEKLVVDLRLHGGDAKEHHLRHVPHRVFELYRRDGKEDEQLYRGQSKPLLIRILEELGYLLLISREDPFNIDLAFGALPDSIQEVIKDYLRCEEVMDGPVQEGGDMAFWIPFQPKVDEIHHATVL
jgi:hypothetical protein